MQLVLLPGMDGTGLLFQPFLQECSKHLPEDVTVQVISYPCDQELCYEQLVEYVRSKLPTQKEIMLVAESFSGPIGYALAAEQSSKIKAVIFVASFLTRPKGLIWIPPPYFTALFIKHIIKTPLPSFLLTRLLFEPGTTEEPLLLFKTAVQKVKRGVLATRIREITSLYSLYNLCLEKQINIPCTYIQADGDRLIARSHVEDFRRIAPQITVNKISGPHFLMQTRPRECAQVVIHNIKLQHCELTNI